MKEWLEDRYFFQGDASLILWNTYVLGGDRPKYRFNFSNGKGSMIFRYDNAAHHKEIYTFPHHKHTPTEIKPSKEIVLAEVLSEIEMMILSEFEKQFS